MYGSGGLCVAAKRSLGFRDQMIGDKILIQSNSQSWSVSYTDPTIFRLDFFCRQLMSQG